MSITSTRTRRFTRDEYYRMADLGFFQGRRAELIRGEIIDMSPQKHRHFTGVLLTQSALERLFGPACCVRVQGPIALDADSEPEPDLAVVKGSPRDYADHPTTALLVVEIADATLLYDTTDKASLYARHHITDYWVLDLNARSLLVHRDPSPDAAAPFGARYASVTAHAASDSVSPLAVPGAIWIADLLP